MRLKCNMIEYFRDQSLFSLIDSVWSGTKGAIDSQDSENCVNNVKQVHYLTFLNNCYRTCF